MGELDSKIRLALIKGFLRKCVWVIPNEESANIGYSISLDKFDKFKESTGYDFSVLWDELSDKEQLDVMYECSGLYDGFVSN